MIKPEVKLKGWVTIKTLAAEKQCTTQYISAQIKRNEIPFIEFPELNGLKLVPSLALQNSSNYQNERRKPEGQN